MHISNTIVLALASLASARAVVGGGIEKVHAPLTLNDTCAPNTLGCQNYDREWAIKPKISNVFTGASNEIPSVEKRDRVGSWSIKEAALNAAISTVVSKFLANLNKNAQETLHPLQGNETSTNSEPSIVEKRDMLGSGTGGHQIMYCPGWPTAVRHNLTHYKIWHFRCFCTRYHRIERQDCSYGWVNNQGPNF